MTTTAHEYPRTSLSIEFPDGSAVMVQRLGEGLYFFESKVGWAWYERLIAREDLEDFWPVEVLQLADDAPFTGERR